MARGTKGRAGQAVVRHGEAGRGKARALLSKEQQRAANRKMIPLASGCLDYFADALGAVAHCSYVGNKQHNGDAPLHWDRSKSTDHADALLRHLVDRGSEDTDGVLHSAKVAWRALALLQTELENAQKAAK